MSDNNKDLQTLVNKILEVAKEERQSNSYTLGQFIKDLETCNPEGIVYIEPFDLYPTGFDSYRGYYEDLAIEFTTDEYKGLRIKELLNKAKECIGKTFIGYKGGEFVMDENSVVWISNYGKVSNQKLSGIKALDSDKTYYKLLYVSEED